MIKVTSKHIRRSAILACCIFAVIFAVKTTGSVRNFIVKRQQLEQEQHKLMLTYEEVKHIQDAIDLYKKDKEEVEKLLFSEKDVPAFLDGISRYAQDALVNISDMKTRKFEEVSMALGTEATKEDTTRASKSLRNRTNASKEELKRSFTLTAMPIHIEVEGAFSSLVAFLGYLEEFKQLLTISNIEINSGKHYPVLECAFTLRIYSLKNLAELAQE